MADHRKLTEIVTDAHERMAALVQEAFDAGRRFERDQLLGVLGGPLAPLAIERQEWAAFSKTVLHAAPQFRAPSSSQRVAPGTIRPLVQQVLRAEGGLTKAEVIRRVQALNADIAAPSITNELLRNENLRRNKTHLYRRKRGVWFLLDDGLPAKEGPAVAHDDRPAGSTLNGSHHDERSIAPSGPAE